MDTVQVNGKWFKLDNSEKFGLTVYVLTNGRGYAAGIKYWKAIKSNTPLYDLVIKSYREKQLDLAAHL